MAITSAVKTAFLEEAPPEQTREQPPTQTPNQTPPNTKTPRAQKPKRRADQRGGKRVTAPQLGRASVPTIASFEVQVKLYTILSQRLLERSFEQLQIDLWLLTVKLAVLGFRKEARAAETLFLEQVEDFEQRLSTALEQIDKQLDDAGITTMPSYGEGRPFTLQITTPLSRRYVIAVQQCDLMLQRIDSLWLQGALPGHKADDMRYQWRGQLQKLANRMREHANFMRGALARGDIRDLDEGDGAAQDPEDAPDASSARATEDATEGTSD